MADPRRRVLLTALGTGRYDETVYDVWGTPAHPSRYVQVALAQSEHGKSGQPPLVVVVLVTPEARAAHWEDLRQELQQHEVETVAVDIRALGDAGAFADLRSVLRAHLRPKDTVLLDITHGFRATAPLLIASVEELAAGGEIARIERVSYGLYDREQPTHSSIWDLSQALVTRRLVDAERGFRDRGYLQGVAQVLTTGVRAGPIWAVCKTWQVALDSHRLDELVRRPKPWWRRYRTGRSRWPAIRCRLLAAAASARW